MLLGVEMIYFVTESVKFDTACMYNNTTYYTTILLLLFLQTSQNDFLLEFNKLCLFQLYRLQNKAHSHKS